MAKPTLDDHYVGIVESRKKKTAPIIEWGDAYPFLELLMSPYTPDGEPRKGMTFLGVIKHGELVCKLSDNETDQHAWLRLGDPLRFFEEIEEALNNRTLNWEPTPEKYRRNGRH